MIFRLIINREAEEEIVARVRQRSELTDKIEALVAGEDRVDELTGYTEEDMAILKIREIECVCVEEGKTFAVYSDGVKYRLRLRLYEAEARLRPDFVRINKSALANWKKIRRFKASIAGAVDIEFKSGYVEYVSRRCFAELKRRYDL